MDLTAALKTIIWSALGIQRPAGDPARESAPTVEINRLARYRCRVVKCASDGATVDLQPDDSSIAPRQNVPVVFGVPGVVAVVQPGAVMWLGWEAGDDARPRAVPDWESATVTKLVVNAQTVYLGEESGAKDVALLDSTVDAGSFTFVPGTGGASLTYFPPGAPVPGMTAITGKVDGACASRVKAK